MIKSCQHSYPTHCTDMPLHTATLREGYNVVCVCEPSVWMQVAGMALEAVKQPVINGYFIAGSLVGPGGAGLIKVNHTLTPCPSRQPSHLSSLLTLFIRTVVRLETCACEEPEEPDC